MKNRINFVLILLLFSATFLLRLGHLDYSNFQGDEIKAQFKLQNGQSISDYLFSQRKGPVQFLITGLYGLIDPSFSSEFFLRLPFAFASILSVLVFYRLGKLYFGETIALYASLLLATNGLFVAFGRIVQYQSITIITSLLCLYSLSAGLRSNKWRTPALYVGLLSASVSILTHFDGIFVIPPAVYLLNNWYKLSNNLSEPSRLRRHIISASTVALLMLLFFYIPYTLSLSEYQLSYWAERISGPPSHSITVFQFYNPLIGIYVYAVLLALSIFMIGKHKDIFLFMLWAIPPFIFMEFIMHSPRTHIYTYLLPLFIFSAMGIEMILESMKRFFPKAGKTIVHTACSVLFLFLFALSYSILVDHQKEYPWSDKKFFHWDIRGQYMEGIMGFPYNRQWKEIGQFFAYNNRVKEQYYTTNEKQIISAFYLPKHMVYCENGMVASQQINRGDGLFMIIVERPQSWENTIFGRSIIAWKDRLVPVKIFTDKNGHLLSSVYYLTMPDLLNLLK
jgi:hypothetical protein